MGKIDFINQMTVALEGRPRMARSLQPSERDLIRYFRTLRGQGSRAILAAYQNYVSSFMIHIWETSTNAREQRLDVGYPGGTCDRWSEIAGRPVDRNGNRFIIDCEGFAFIAQHLLPEAGWRFNGYRLLFRTTRQLHAVPDDAHIMAEISTSGGVTFLFGGPLATRSWMEEARNVFGTSIDVVESSLCATQEDAYNQARIMIESGATFEEAPLLQMNRRTFSPPSMID